MTGYAKNVEVMGEHEITVEIKSLNSKHLNVNFSLPSFLMGCELDLNSLVVRFIKRGKVMVRVHLKFLSPPKAIEVDEALAKSYYDALELLVSNLGIPEPVKLEDVLRFKDILRFELDEEETRRICDEVKRVLEKTLEILVKEKEREGSKLKEVLGGFLDTMEDRVMRIREEANSVVERYARALRENVRKIVPDDFLVNEDILETAIAVLAERSDIREELDRLESHISRAREALNSNEPVGATLDFLAQEMLREFNTILSKTRSLGVSNLALDGKILVNSFREQVQNVE